jgi:nucleotide-binding universal stress UspA family protein
MAFSRGEQRVKRPDQETLAQIESTDLNKGIKHILVSNDTSSMGGRSFETILPFLAKDSARRVTAIRCYDKLGRANAADVDLEIRNKLESLALKYDLITNVHVNMAEIAEGDDVGAVLVKEAEALGPDLVVVGTKHTGVFCGHTCDTVVHESSVPVLVVRSFGCPHNPKARIMVAVDGSVVSLAALRYTVRLASALMTVVPVVIVPGGPKIAALVKQAIETVEGPRCVVEEPVVANMREQFNVGQSLCAVADELNADIIALGADNKGDQELGNVESFLIYQANCHVLVYKNEWLMDRQGTSSGSNSRRASKMSRRESLKIPHDGPRGSFVRTLSQLPADVDGISEERQSMESNAPPDATDFTFGSAEYLPVTLADK